MTSKLSQVVATARPNFMVLSPLCVLLGIAVAVHQTGSIDPTLTVLVLLGGILAHAAVNLLNEYEDFRSGLDSITLRTPFSGGSGTLPAHPDAASATLLAGVACLAATAAIGLYVSWVRGPGILPLGVMGLVIVVAYTRWITRSPLLCLLAPGVGFGPLMVIGTVYVLTGRYDPIAMVASLVPFFLVSDLLLINQFPDVEADRQIGRRHLPIVAGRAVSARIYAAFILAPFAVVLAAWASGAFPVTAGLAVLGLPPAAYLAVQVTRRAQDDQGLMPLLGINVAVVLGTILLLAIGLML